MAIRVLYPYVGDSVGGSHISSTLLIRHLDRARYEPVIALHQEGPLSEFLEQQQLPWLSFPLQRLAGETPSLAGIGRAELTALPSLLKFIRQHKIDLVHTNDLRTHLTWAGAARLSRRPWFWHQRVIMSRAPIWRVLSVAASQVISISHAVAASLPALGNTPSAVIHNPLEMTASTERQAARQALRREMAIAPTATVIGYIGNMTEQKRPLTFIRAAAQIVEDNGGDIFFALFGDDRGGQQEEASRLAQALGIRERVFFAGHRHPIEPWLRGLDVLLAPGVNDGFGRTLIEAMYAEAPIVAADSGGHGEIIENGRTGLLTPPDDFKAMAEAVANLLADDSGRGLIVTRARRSVGERFSTGRHADAVMSLYRQHLGEK